MDQNRVALLIDSENVGDVYLEDIIKEIPKYGRLVISRFYGDINKISSNWREKALDYAIKPFHQYNTASGKNAADMDMALDALSIKYDDKADIFFIVSSDSDFTPLAVRRSEEHTSELQSRPHLVCRLLLEKKKKKKKKNKTKHVQE